MNSNFFSGIYKLFDSISPLAPVFLLLSMITALIIVVILASIVYDKYKASKEEKKIIKDKEEIKDIDYDKLAEDERADILRTALAPDGFDPNPLNEIVISDTGKEVYERSFTLAALPKRTTFANTFSDLFNFDNCTSSVFIQKLTSQEVSRSMDKNIVTLDGERIAAAKVGDTNRIRKIDIQHAETTTWAREVEKGEAAFYKVGFLFTLRANTFDKLSEMTDSFRSLTLQKDIQISSCFGLQAEAFLSNEPMNHVVTSGANNIVKGTTGKNTGSINPLEISPIIYHMMDKFSLSTIFNHTQSEFSHRDGIFLGRNMLTQKPITFDIYDGAHTGYTLLIVGKTGTGKSLSVKIMTARYLPFGYRFVSIDSQPIGSSGEYAGIAEASGGVNFMIKSGANNIMNIFEVGESLRFIKDGKKGYEVRELELRDKIAQVTNTILTMIQGQRKIDDFKLMTYIQRIVIDNISELYENFGICDGKPDSLYYEGDVMNGTKMVKGKIKKKLPIISDYYKLILEKKRDNKKDELMSVYDIILSSLKDFVKEIIFSVNSITYFTREEYEQLPSYSNGKHYFINNEGIKEDVEVIYGIRSYFDGQSTISISKECPFSNFDISQLPDAEKVLARQIAIDFVNEQFVKKNSESLQKAEKLVVLIDEAHENFIYEYARQTIDNEVRTARKKNVSLWLATQSLAEYNRYEETKSILRNAAVKFVFKQDYQDREYIKKALNLTDAQVDMVLELGGDPSDKASKNARKGEMCIVDNTKVCFCKVDYLRKTEEYIADTDPETIKRMFEMGA